MSSPTESTDITMTRPSWQFYGYSTSEIKRHAELLRFFVSTYLKTRYGNLVLGYLWWLLNPLLWIFVYWLLVSVIFQRGTPQYPVFVACAILPWRSFVISLGQSVTAITGREKLIKQVSFPKYIIPLSIVAANSINMIFSMLVLVIIGMAYKIYPTPYILFAIPIMIIQTILTLGMSYILSVLGVYFIDTKNVLEFILRMWLYLSPSLYDIDRIPSKLLWIFIVNPFVGIFTGYRNSIMYGKPPEPKYIIPSIVISITTLIVGIYIFAKHEKEFAKLV